MSYFPARRHARVEFQTLPWVFTLRLAESAPADRPLRLEARNMSRGGLKFLSNRKFKLFELLTIHLLEKKGGKALDPLQGKVVRVEEIDTGYGERTFGIALEFADEAATKLLLFLPDGPAKLSPQPFEGK
jgi:hypothetical protein